MTDQPEKLDLTSHDIAEDKRQELLRLFPEVRTEGGKLDFERLKLALGETVDTGKERYGMTWPGKADCFKTIQRPSLATLRPCPEESVNFDTTENLIIEGDNLEVLKLLQKSYLGKVKMIYIDPPYNTGNDFIYPDNYAESLQTYLEYTGQVDAEGRKFGTNTDTDGRFHSKWMNMMYPRLYLARNLLSDDGVMFISIDNHEASNLNRLCDEIFGEENVLAQLCWRTDGNFDNQAKFKEVHEYVLVVTRSVEAFPHPPVVDPSIPEGSKLFRPEIRNTIVKNGPKNPVSEVELPAGFPCDERTATIDTRTSAWPHYLERAVIRDGTLIAPVTVRSGWSSKELLLDFIRNKCKPILDAKGQETEFVITSTGAIEAVKKRSERQSHVITVLSGLGGPQRATAEIEEINVPFDDYPKPTSLISYFLKMNEGDDFIAMDFFAGSGTTAHAVLDLNKQDDGNRKFILVQLPEPTGREDIPTIADITKERVRRVIKKLNDEDEASKKNPAQLPLTPAPLPEGEGRKQDRGFRVFKLAESNFKTWQADAPKNAESLTTQLELHVDHIRDDRAPDDLLYEILLKSGFPLTTKVEKLDLGGKPVHSIADGALVICLDRALTLEAIRAMAAKKPERVVCLDEGFAGNDQLKANAVQIFKTQGVASFKTV
jgi:adenine-specific DNA-methyltransferase